MIKSNKKFLILTTLITLFLLIISFNAFAFLEQGQTKIFAVNPNNKAISADLILEMEPGTGQTYFNIKPLTGTSVQRAEENAQKLMLKYFPKQAIKVDYKFKINADASVVEGPSAGAAMALLMYSMLNEKQLPKEIGITGTISESGLVGPVGGVFEKSKKASEEGVKLFMIPKGEAKQIASLPEGIKKINLIDYALTNWNLKVLEVSNFDEVIKFAYSDINAIDINTMSEPELPEFQPDEIPLKTKLEPIKEITDKLIKKTELNINNAKNVLNTVVLSDPTIIEIVQIKLTQAENDLKQAKLLYSTNYLYSSANFAFLANNIALIVKDILENPSLVEEDSVVFNVKLTELKQDITVFENQLNGIIPVESFEWNVAAKQRLLWAKETLNELINPNTIVISVGENKYVKALNRIEKYETALSWFNAAKDFKVLAEKFNPSNKFYNNNLFKEKALKLLIKAENSLKLLELPQEQITLKLNSAKTAFDNNWFIASAFDSSFVLALIQSDLNLDVDLSEQYFQILNERLNNLENEMVKSNKDFIWASLYFDHTKYFLKASEFYKQSNQLNAALQNIQNSFALLYLSENIFNTANQAYDVLGKSKKLDLPKAINPAIQENVFFELTYFALIIIFFIVIILLLNQLFKLLFGKINLVAVKEIQKIEKEKLKLKDALVHGLISPELFKQINDNYEKKLKELKKEKLERANYLIELEKLRGKIISLQHSIHVLKHYYSEGIISKKDYTDRLSLLKNNLRKIREEIKKERNVLRAEEKKFSMIASKASKLKTKINKK